MLVLSPTTNKINQVPVTTSARVENREMHIHFAEPLNDTVKAENDTVNDTVFSLIRQNKNITAKQISGQLQISLSTTKRIIKELKEQKIFERIGSEKTGYWK